MISEQETASYPRDKAATMASDWSWILKTLRMCEDRALTGTPLHLRRPPWLSPQADVKMLSRNSIMRAIDNVFSTAVVDEPEEGNAD